ncbi:putative metallophosphoesterase [Paraliobacillus sp. PM-2]|uniref:metallophosphoesterase n=1 Tax=Paraliobacillus sp. PM-2 TaxID=1462524 RepID=UPI00061C2155|nr:metallophosphoesterase [Paraliobacillus sp. PM-2]CQR47942.1 putative metallophosphoesterase [Paraliobacillus sp. PM-2]
MFLYAGLIVAVAGSFKVFYDTNIFKVNHIKIKSEKITNRSSFTILQLTDVHNKTFGKDNKPLIDKIKRLNPDIIVITGDLIDRKTTDFTAMFDLVEQLQSMNEQIFFVSGNHEWGNEKTLEFFTGLAERNIHILDNTNRTINFNENRIQLVGVADYATEHDDLTSAMLDIHDETYTILLSHVPDITNDLVNESIDLILSGHTHGGQIRAPFIGALVAPEQGYFPQLDKGMYQWKDEQYLYIDSGLGTTWMPIRFLNQSQMTMITIEGKR